MGVRTYIQALESNDINAKTAEEVCLGKMGAYVDMKDVSKMETVKWLEGHLTDNDDKDYLEQYKDVGYVGEYITFIQVFTHDEILEFLECFYNDKTQYSSFKHVCGLRDVVLLLENYDYFSIEWMGA